MNKNADLCSRLGDLLNVPPISIELLPGDASEWLASAPPEHAPFLFVDNNLGVPHKLAYKAYLEAVARFRAVRPRHDSIDHSHSAELLASSAVLLLVNPAHQTALNARKRLVLLGTHSAAHELRFTDALLTLRDGAKQSILWHHRRWVLRRIHPPLPSPSPSPFSESQAKGHGDGVDTLADIALSPATFRAEIAAVERACEAYPRNYHAWAHRFLCAEALVHVLAHVLSAFSPSSASASSPHDRHEALRELEAERAHIRTWVERHVADYSAMQYACRLEALVQGLPAPDTETKTKTETEKGAEAGAHALELVRAYSSHEALWLYLRGAVALDLFPPGTQGDAGAAIDGLTESYLREGATAVAGHQVVSGTYGHAVRFSAWRKWSVSPRVSNFNA
ncbi:hypothetical protein GSI_04022 [Ganoderma sinense ZZ0214-1]|uniref:Protein prenylyltransferase n=1 Tax=Ganoderma sinense ZZ0214-1 TaxID=1077348 RepID=A0A2G8SI21_9APHY|nr:hypothetical protein GSI_04022 [Ganoderma sinense ZZ0214-1]